MNINLIYLLFYHAPVNSISCSFSSTSRLCPANALFCRILLPCFFSSHGHTQNSVAIEARIDAATLEPSRVNMLEAKSGNVAQNTVRTSAVEAHAEEA